MILFHFDRTWCHCAKGMKNQTPWSFFSPVNTPAWTSARIQRYSIINVAQPYIPPFILVCRIYGLLYLSHFQKWSICHFMPQFYSTLPSAPHRLKLCNRYSTLQLYLWLSDIIVPISIFKVFFLLLHLEELPCPGPILTENTFLLSHYGEELNWVCGALWLSCKHRTMLQIWPLKHVTQLAGLQLDLGHLSVSCAVTGQWARSHLFTHMHSQTWIWLRCVCVCVSLSHRLTTFHAVL